MELKIKGLDTLIKKVGGLNESLQGDCQAALNDWADRVSLDAKQTLSRKTSNTGRLANSITPRYGKLTASVVVSANYAAYIEFGTRKFAAEYVGSLPSEWDKMAGQSKGSAGGSFHDLLVAIRQWCKDRGIDNKLAYPIARKIVIKGIRPQPYLYPAVTKNNPILLQDIENIFK